MKLLYVFLTIAITLPSFLQAQNLKPYTIGAETTGTINDTKSSVIAALKATDIDIIGQYKPASDLNRWVIVITSQEIKSAVQEKGGLAGFALALKVAITKEEDKIIVSYTTPEYWGNAYFQGNYSQVQSYYTTLSSKLTKALNPLGNNGGQAFGSKKGVSNKTLQKYHYMLGMPYFQDNVQLNTFANYEEAKSIIDNNLATGIDGTTKVYSVELADKKIKLYGIGLSGENGEAKFTPIIDFGNPKHTAFLPYEILLLDDKAYMLHGRFRIALSFPDLSMGTFMKIVSTPSDINDMLEKSYELDIHNE